MVTVADSDPRIAILALSVGTLLILPKVISEIVAKELGPLVDVLKLLKAL